MYETNFSVILYPQGMDPGHPIIFPAAHTLLWKIIGPKLWVSHFFQAFFTILCFYGFYQLDRIFQTKYWICILMGINPLFISMAAGLNTHMPLLAASVFYLVAIEKNNSLVKWLSLCCLLLTHNQGMLIAAVFLFVDFVYLKNKTYWILTSTIPWILWLYIHKYHTGWYLFPPEYAEFRGLGNLKTLFKNSLIILWRIMDFGQFVIWALAIWFYSKKEYFNKKNTFFLVLIVLSILSVWVAVKYSIAHRYLIFAVFFATILAAKSLIIIKNKFIPWLCLLLLISGSFWYYPGKQLSDANIQYRHYFNIYEKLQTLDMVKNVKIYSTPPNESHAQITHIINSPYNLNINPLNEIKSLDSAHFIMHGNVCGPLSQEATALIENMDFITIKSGPAFINLYSKKPISPTLKEQFPSRKLSRLEIWMASLKSKLK